MKTKAKKSLGLKPPSQKGFVRAKKALGQHFLKSKKVVRDIINAGDINAQDIVLEIGPGKGILTEQLLRFAGKVIAVEKDQVLVRHLKEKFRDEIVKNKLEVVNADILQFSIINSQFSKGYKLVANIPYYITGEILRKFLSTEYQPNQMVLLVQKEVAQRIVARDKKESILSISVRAYGKPRYIKKVPARLFSPPPKVDSAILSIEDISKDFFKDVNEEKFFGVVKTGFAHKRKFLVRNLEPLLGAAKKRKKKKVEIRGTLREIFKECNIPEKVRAEDLGINDWKCLVQNMATQN